MKSDLFFVPAIAAALRDPGSERALADAFARISTVGAQIQYRYGSLQFRRFMACVREHTRIDFIVERNGRHLASLGVYPVEGMATVAGIVPATYTVKLSTGRVIWEDKLSADDVLWARALDGLPLALAADTGPTDRPRSRRELLLNGELCLSVFPGVEAGEIGVERQGSRFPST